MAQISTSQAISQGMTAQHIASNLSNYEAARSGFFVFVVDDLSNLLATNYTGGIEDHRANPQESDLINRDLAEQAIRLNVTKCDVPHYNVEVLEFKRGNDKVKFAGTPSFGDGNITVDDLVGLDTKSILMSWLRLAYDPRTFKGGRMKDYKKTCTLMEYTQDYELIRTWTLYGCFINELTEDGFDKESDGKRQIQAKFSYDRAVMELPEEENI